VRLKAQRLLNAQAAKAGKAGVVAGEGSLLINQAEAASLAQYEEDLAAYGHELQANMHGYQSRLLKANAPGAGTMAVETALAAGSSAASSYSSYGYGGNKGRGGSIATGGDYM
jgi:hypothetical protein